jgi:hypothetical protein
MEANRWQGTRPYVWKHCSFVRNHKITCYAPANSCCTSARSCVMWNQKVTRVMSAGRHESSERQVQTMDKPTRALHSLQLLYERPDVQCAGYNIRASNHQISFLCNSAYMARSNRVCSVGQAVSSTRVNRWLPVFLLNHATAT